MRKRPFVLSSLFAPLALATGGWGPEGFKGDSTTERAVRGHAAKACFECHGAQKGEDYVSSSWRP